MRPATRDFGRRRFLKGAGVTLALPLMDSLSPGATLAPSMKMVCVGNTLGFYRPMFFPKQPGRNYAPSHLLEPLAPHREAFTVFSGLDHSIKGGHHAVHSYLSGVHMADAKAMPEGNITIDQRAAETVGGSTRYPSLTVGSKDGIHGGCLLSWTRSGARVPPIPTPRELFRRLFVDDTAADRARAVDRFHMKRSILDAVNGDAKALDGKLDRRDREKLDEYFTSVREVEKKVGQNEQWAHVPKPRAPMAEPRDRNTAVDLPVLYDLIALALQNGSTRIATLELGGSFKASDVGVKAGYHALSHHGQVKEKIDQLVTVERYQTEQFARFLGKMRSLEEGGAPLLDSTMVLLGSGMGNANAHTNDNLPIVLAGGGFRHQGYRAFPPKGAGRAPLCNLFLSMLHRFGVETDRFGTSTGTLAGLE